MLAFAAAVTIPPAAARADEGALAPRLRYVAHDPDRRCPDEPSFRRLVVARLGRDPFVESGADEVTIALELRGSEALGRLVVARAGKRASERQLSEHASQCPALVEALATGTALAIDPVRAQATSAAPPSATPPGPPSPPPPEPAPPPTAPPPAARPAAPVRVSRPLGPEPGPAVLVRVAGALALGAAPGPTMGVEAAVGLERGPFAAFLEARVETQPADAMATNATALRATIFGGGLAPCLRLGAFLGCVVARVGVLQGLAPEVVSPNLGSSVHASVGPRLGLWSPSVGPLAFTASVELGATMVRTTLLVDGQPAWTAPALWGGVALGIGYRSR